MSILDQFNVPTINLDFKLMTQNRNILSGLRAIVSETGATVDFAAIRATVKQTENRFGIIEQADANVPALSFNNGVAQGFLSEEAATNLLLRSEEFDNAYWNKSAGLTVDANVATAPDGTMTADKVNKGTGTVLQRLSSVSSGQVKSIWARTVSGTGTVALLGFNGIAKYQFNLTEEWQRFEAVSDADETGGTTFYGVDFRFGSLTEVLLWGAQLETGSRATSYIKTVAATATRAKDNVTISDVAIALSPTSGSIQTTSNYPTDYPLIINGLQATVTGIKTIRFEYTTSEIKLFVDNVLADSATGTYDWSDLNEIQLGHYNGADQPNFELRDLIVRKA